MLESKGWVKKSERKRGPVWSRANDTSVSLQRTGGWTGRVCHGCRIQWPSGSAQALHLTTVVALTLTMWVMCYVSRWWKDCHDDLFYGNATCALLISSCLCVCLCLHVCISLVLKWNVWLFSFSWFNMYSMCKLVLSYLQSTATYFHSFTCFFLPCIVSSLFY